VERKWLSSAQQKSIAVENANKEPIGFETVCHLLGNPTQQKGK
jgi:hypothetical protein